MSFFESHRHESENTMNTTPMPEWTKISAGHYEMRLSAEQYDRYDVLHVEATIHFDQTWMLAYPGSAVADDTFPTMSAAKRAAHAHFHGAVNYEVEAR